MSDYLNQGKSSKSTLLKALCGRASGGKVTPADAVRKHEARLHKGQPRTQFASGGGIEDSEDIEDIEGAGPLERLDRKKKKKSKSDITIVIDVGKDKATPPGPVPPLPPAAPPAPPPGAPGGANPMAAMMGGGPKPPMPPLGGGAPMMGRKSGGRVGAPKTDGDYTRGLEEDPGTSNEVKKSDPYGGDKTKGLKKGGRAKRASGGAADQQRVVDKTSDDIVVQLEAMSPDERASYFKAFKEEGPVPNLNLKPSERKCGGRAKRAWGGKTNYPVGHPQNKETPEPKSLDPDTIPESTRKKLMGRKDGGRTGKKFGGDASEVLKAVPLGIGMAKKLFGSEKNTGGAVAGPNGKAGTDSGEGRLNQAKHYARKR